MGFKAMGRLEIRMGRAFKHQQDVQHPMERLRILNNLHVFRQLQSDRTDRRRHDLALRR